MGNDAIGITDAGVERRIAPRNGPCYLSPGWILYCGRGGFVGGLALS
jgi:hypothetical protein